MIPSIIGGVAIGVAVLFGFIGMAIHNDKHPVTEPQSDFKERSKAARFIDNLSDGAKDDEDQEYWD